jgi:hypothetical protein
MDHTLEIHGHDRDLKKVVIGGVQSGGLHVDHGEQDLVSAGFVLVGRGGDCH